MSADDALAIANLKAVYCLAADTSTSDQAGALAMFEDLFVDDFVGDYGFKQLNGPKEIADFMIQAIGGGSEWMVHSLGSPRIIVDDDSATGDWTIQVESRRREGAGLMSVVGRYSDSFRKTADGWRIASIKFVRYE